MPHPQLGEHPFAKEGPSVLGEGARMKEEEGHRNWLQTWGAGLCIPGLWHLICKVGTLRQA